MQTIKQKQATAYQALKDTFGYTNVMQAPKIKQVTISVGVGKIRSDKNKLAVIEDRLAKITGQKPVRVAAKKSIATFKVREGDTAGYKVSLHGPKMYQFLDKFVNISLPRTKDFRGINRTVIDEMGNMTIGLKEHVIFPETGDEEIRDIFGLAVTVTTTATKKDALAFFEHIGVPFKKLEEAK